MKLAGKAAFVTGGARGIGRAICEAYAAEGARVAVADRLEDDARDTAAALGAGSISVGMDVSDPDAIGGAVAQVESAFGGIDVLVNNAGVFGMGPIEEITFDDYRTQFDVNVAGTIFTTKAVIPGMKRSGGGSIVNFASQAGRRGEALVMIYCASKAAIVSVTQSMALEFAPHGIRVNAIAPGVVDTPMWDVVDGLFAKYEGKPVGQKKREVGDAVPLGRMGSPSDIAGPAVFLASDDARYVTAQTLNVDGGNWMS